MPADPPRPGPRGRTAPDATRETGAGSGPGQAAYTCRNCDQPLHPCAQGADCTLYGWRHPDGSHECVPRLGGLLFTFPAELDPKLDAPAGFPKGNTGVRRT